MDTGIFTRHERIALQFSGGRDSLAILYLYREWWDRLTVYWLNPGNPFPETLRIVEHVRGMVPNFEEIAGHQRALVAAEGWPSDVVPVAHTGYGQFTLGEQPFMIQGRFGCCTRALTIPMHERMLADGVTCIIRGRRSDEADQSPARHGSVIDGIEFQFPIWEWSASQVMDYLTDVGAPIPDFYQYGAHSFDCMDCTAWWGEGISTYLKARHPEQFQEYVRRVTLIKQAIFGQMDYCEV